MDIKKTVTRKGLLNLLLFLDSGTNKVTGEELGHPSPRSINYIYRDEGGEYAQTEWSEAQC